MKTVIAVPSRYSSVRLPGKPLVDIGGVPMIVRVWRRCGLVGGVDRVIVATDDIRIKEVLGPEGAEVVMTSPDHGTGTDRIAEAVRGMECDLVVNVQGDEPFFDPAAVEALIDYFAGGGAAPVATLASPVGGRAELESPSVVKVVVNLLGEAMYFSRLPIPYRREQRETGERIEGGKGKPFDEAIHLRHHGIYAFRSVYLQRLASLPSSPAERSECLEQLRILENGWKIQVVTRNLASCGVDTPEDLERARSMAEEEEQ